MVLWVFLLQDECVALRGTATVLDDVAPHTQGACMQQLLHRTCAPHASPSAMWHAVLQTGLRQGPSLTLQLLKSSVEGSSPLPRLLSPAVLRVYASAAAPAAHAAAGASTGLHLGRHGPPSVLQQRATKDSTA